VQELPLRSLFITHRSSFTKGCFMAAVAPAKDPVRDSSYYLDKSPNNDCIKIVMVGRFGAGKTSLIQRYVNNQFNNLYKTTIGVDFSLKLHNLADERQVKLAFWDIAGMERFGSATRLYYKQALCAFVVFDATMADAFKDVVAWKTDIDNKVFLPGTETRIPVMLLANKIDLTIDERIADKTDEQMDEFCRSKEFIGWAKTSAKTGSGIQDAVARLVNEVMQKVPIVAQVKQGITLTEEPKPKDEKNCSLSC
jgi:Ras-related protein Rab-32